MARTRDDTAVDWPAVNTAVALLTAQRGGFGDSRADILRDADPAEVLAAMEILAGVFSRRWRRAPMASRPFQFIGEAAALHASQQPEPAGR